MDNFEKVEKLRERANVSYEEAKQALENSNWDILDAMIYLEKNGKTRAPESSSYTTQSEKKKFERYEEPKESGFKDNMRRFGKWCRSVIDKGNTNYFCVEQEGHEAFRLPVTVLVILLILAFWVVLPLLIIGLFFNMRYSFQGPDMHAVDIDINKAMDTVADAANNIKNDFSNSVNKDSSEDNNNN